MELERSNKRSRKTREMAAKSKAEKMSDWIKVMVVEVERGG